jgi:hypothetical protein
MEIYIPLKGQLKCLESLSSYSNSSEKVIAKEFYINNLTTGNRPLKPHKILMETSQVGQGLYLDSLDLSYKTPFIVRKENGEIGMTLKGNSVDHHNSQDFLKDFLFGMVRLGCLFIF